MSTTQAAKNEPRKRRIVVACKKAQDSQLLSALLQRFEYEVTVAHNAVQAHELACSMKPDLIITDVAPPGPGTDIFGILRDDQRTASLPVVFLVSLSDVAAESRCLGMGAAACITKPVQAEELYRTVQEIIEPHPRVHMRIDTKIDVEVNGVSLDCGNTACTVDLSMYGMFIPMTNPYPRNRHLNLDLRIKDRTISAKGSVLFSHTAAAGSRKHSGMGLKFTEIAPADREFIGQYIHDEVMRGTTFGPAFGR